jgi:galactokinase
MAALGARVENNWVQAQTGLMDHLASLCGERDHALEIDFDADTLAPVTLELGEWRIVTLDSGERHLHAGVGYNERRAECAQACQLLGVKYLSRADARAADELPEPFRSRTLHVLREDARVRETVAALAAGELTAVGEILDASHASLRDLFEVSTPALETTRAKLIEAGAAGARVVGGGFGGNVLALMPPGKTPPAGALQVRPSDGARLL